MAPRGSAYNTDWILSNSSNIHVANHRDWFTEFHKLESHIAVFPHAPATTEVCGIGTVVLETRTRRKCKTITLENVLYVPSYMCNIFAFREENAYQVGLLEKKSITTRAGQVVGLVIDGPLQKLLLKRQRKTQTSLDSDGTYYIHASWPSRDTYVEPQEYRPAPAPARVKARKISVPPLTTAQRRFVREHFGSEFKFLIMYGLKIHICKQRAEGRAILKAIMAADDGDSGEGSNNNNDSEHVLLRPLTTAEKEFLKRHYRGEFRFLRIHGLRIHDRKQRAEGREILRTIMAVDDDTTEDEDEDRSCISDSDDGSEDPGYLIARDFRDDPMSHVADVYFSSEQLDWIETNWRHSAGFMPAMTSTNPENESSSLPRLTDAEKKFLKDYDGEFKFLRCYQLKITDEEERAEGRAILKAIMAQENEPEWQHDARALAELEEDPTSHIADWHFGYDQLEWMAKHYRHSGGFMVAHGLKPDDELECEKAIGVVRGLMEK
ncbi:uncharacterized protein MYCGRDRAFT_107790 [Zymoseptoria tritici IPO323]|uniref:Retrovirus-related Pol polyprotein from transposon TNT 1-94-like beta-barrel domain-containing protein n=1 Tax=Zymoseptoria tritici (strain CBS 115943 / IPO323) TaxID=336722 RepID=F9X1M8_ZYMTI|nr:uncharacterized protein MYCGRDRAFT_107790 [Zymoseptoria tritici IPO323]EGP91805.1 hypothetical protein MYCGRDRAFT_107790 [Zymoseptoria tritici IPO323]